MRSAWFFWLLNAYACKACIGIPVSLLNEHLCASSKKRDSHEIEKERNQQLNCGWHAVKKWFTDSLCRGTQALFALVCTFVRQKPFSHLMPRLLGNTQKQNVKGRFLLAFGLRFVLLVRALDDLVQENMFQFSGENE